MKLSKILNQQFHVRFTTYCLVIIKFFILYSAKYKKKGFKSSVREDATFHSTFILHTQIGGNLKIFSINSPKSAQFMFYIRVMYVRQTTEGDYITPFDVSKQRHAMRPGELSHSGKVMWHARCCQ